jgi:hypothetical protein
MDIGSGSEVRPGKGGRNYNAKVVLEYKVECRHV